MRYFYLIFLINNCYSALYRTFKTKISNWNTGLIWAHDYEAYKFGKYGLVCQGNRKYTIGNTFGQIVCQGILYLSNHLVINNNL